MMNMVRGGPGGRLRTKRSSIENEEMSLSYQAVKPVCLGMAMAEGEGEKVEVGSRFVMYLRGTLADEPLASRERRTNRLPFRNDYTFAWSRHHRADSSDSDSTREEHTAHVTIMHRINQFKMSKSAIRVTKE